MHVIVGSYMSMATFPVPRFEANQVEATELWKTYCQNIEAKLMTNPTVELTDNFECNHTYHLNGDGVWKSAADHAKYRLTESQNNQNILQLFLTKDEKSGKKINGGNGNTNGNTENARVLSFIDKTHLLTNPLTPYRPIVHIDEQQMIMEAHDREFRNVSVWRINHDDYVADTDVKVENPGGFEGTLYLRVQEEAVTGNVYVTGRWDAEQGTVRPHHWESQPGNKSLSMLQDDFNKAGLLDACCGDGCCYRRACLVQVQKKLNELNMGQNTAGPGN